MVWKKISSSFRKGRKALMRKTNERRIRKLGVSKFPENLASFIEREKDLVKKLSTTLSKPNLSRTFKKRLFLQACSDAYELRFTDPLLYKVTQKQTGIANPFTSRSFRDRNGKSFELVLEKLSKGIKIKLEEK